MGHFLTKLEDNGIISCIPGKTRMVISLLFMKGMMVMTEKRIQFRDSDDVETFVKAAGQCDFDIDILYDHIYIDAKSFLGVLGLGLRKELTVKYFGENVKFENVLKNYAVA